MRRAKTLSELTPADVARVEMQLRLAVEAALEEGWELKKSQMRNLHDSEPPCCCGLGAVVVDVPVESGIAQEPLYVAAAERLGLEREAVTPIWQGFDGGRPSTVLDEEAATEGVAAHLRAVGARLREHYLDTTDEVVAQ